MGKSERVQINALPKSTDSFWEFSEIENITLPIVQECKHEFRYTATKTVECSKCGSGYYLSGHERLEKGHIYFGDTFVI